MQTAHARIAVIYYSSSGTVHRLAEAIAQGAAVGGAEVRLRRVAELARIRRSPRTRRGAGTSRPLATSRRPRSTI